MKQNIQLKFSSRFRKQSKWIVVRRRRRICELSCRWCWRFSWRFGRGNWRKFIWNCRHFSWRFASWTGWVGRIRTLTFRSYQNYQHVSPLCRTTSVYSCTIQHSAGIVSLQHHSRLAVSIQLWTAAHNTSINKFNCLHVPVEGVTLTEHCAGVNCWFVGWYNGGYELYCNCRIYNMHKVEKFYRTLN